jgi:hypothetical protein
MTEREHVVDCKIPAGKNHPHVWRRINKLVRVERADHAKPFVMRCRRCHAYWDDVELVDPREVSCSNRYSDNIEIVKLKLIVVHSA